MGWREERREQRNLPMTWQKVSRHMDEFQLCIAAWPNTSKLVA